MDDTTPFFGVVFFYVGKTMKLINRDKLSRRIKVQERIIQELEHENSSLKTEIEELNQKLLFEQTKPIQGYERAKKMISEIESKQNELQTLIDEARIAKETYDKETKEILLLKANLKTETSRIIKKMRRRLNSI